MSDVLIVGGGLIGMLTARELSLAGMNVTILEQGETGHESSWAGGGIISPLYPWRYPEEVSALAKWGQTYYPELIEEINSETGLDAELIQSGLLIFADEYNDALEWAKKWQANLQVIDKKELFSLENKLSQSLLAHDKAIWMPEVRQVRNPRLVKVTRKYLEKQKVSIREKTEVTGFISKAGKVTGVTSSNGDIYADKVIVAGGAWSASLLEGLNINFDISPVKGQMILFKTDPGMIKHIILSQDRYVIPRKDGRVLVGSTIEHTGFDKTTSKAALNELTKEAIRIIPELEQAKIEHHWAGLRPSSPEGIPYICEHATLKDLYINSGHFRNGVVLGPASARLMADIVLNRSPILDPNGYQPS